MEESFAKSKENEKEKNKDKKEKYKNNKENIYMISLFSFHTQNKRNNWYTINYRRSIDNEKTEIKYYAKFFKIEFVQIPISKSIKADDSHSKTTLLKRKKVIIV